MSKFIPACSPVFSLARPTGDAGTKPGAYLAPLALSCASSGSPTAPPPVGAGSPTAPAAFAMMSASTFGSIPPGGSPGVGQVPAVPGGALVVVLGVAEVVAVGGVGGDGDATATGPGPPVFAPLRGPQAAGAKVPG